VIILGIDPGYAILGWSVIDDSTRLLGYGTITTDCQTPLNRRLLVIHERIDGIIREFSPGTAAMERLFFQRNTTTAMDVARTSGVVLLTLALSGIPVHEYTPSQIKMAVTGYGRADKKQMQAIIQKLFNLDEVPRPDDAADALAVALCHSCAPSAGLPVVK
jgi:crossover junction endodeoxyribonuclease RuvC